MRSDWGIVFTLDPLLDPKTHRRRRCRQGPQHRAGDKLPAECTRPNTSLRAAMRGVPEQWQRRLDVSLVRSNGSVPAGGDGKTPLKRDVCGFFSLLFSRYLYRCGLLGVGVLSKNKQLDA